MLLTVELNLLLSLSITSKEKSDIVFECLHLGPVKWTNNQVVDVESHFEEARRFSPRSSVF